MHQSRRRMRVGRTQSGGRYGPKWRINMCVLAGSFLLLGSVVILQLRLTIVSVPKSEHSSESEELNANSSDVDTADDKSSRDGDERRQKLEQRRKTDNEEIHSFGDMGGESSLDDNSSRVFNEVSGALETEDEVLDGVRDVEDVDDEDVDDLESFGGNTVGWLSETDETEEKKNAHKSVGEETKLEVDRGQSEEFTVGDASRSVEEALLKNIGRKVDLASSNGVDVAKPVVTRVRQDGPSLEKSSDAALSIHFNESISAHIVEDSTLSNKSKLELKVKEGFDGATKESNSGMFSTDDEPIDEDTRKRLEKMLTIEDVLMINRGAALSNNENWKKAGGASKKERKGEMLSDPLNPANNALLQDPDSLSEGGLTKYDKALLKSLRGSTIESHSRVLNNRADRDRKSEERSKSAVTTALGNEHVGLGSDIRSRGTVGLNNGNEQLSKSSNFTDREVSIDNKMNNASVRVGGQVVLVETKQGASTLNSIEGNLDELLDSKKEGRRVHDLNPRSDPRKWSNFPGLKSQLSFSGFMDEFLFDNKCALRVFMVWMTPPWSFTVRHQRVLESLLYIHPKACVVVFSETMELNFFKWFVEDGYRVTVVVPNLMELLKDTPTDVFASIWMEWRKTTLFYIHYSELLRLAALYKYGGIYLDFDMIVLKPLTTLKSTIGKEALSNGVNRPNGALMIFERFSPFLNRCMIEFTATYDETLRDWNGAALINRVWNSWPDIEDVRLTLDDRPNLEPPFSFFPLSSSNISRFFDAPQDNLVTAEEQHLLNQILLESTAVHMWNGLTYNLIPEPGSLVQKIMDKNCILCADIL